MNYEEQQIGMPQGPQAVAKKPPGLVMSGLAAAGNFLDLPASMIRDTVTLRNPFDQLLSPFSDKNRAKDGDLVPFYNGPGTSLLGMVIGGALDPLTYIGGGLVKRATMKFADKTFGNIMRKVMPTGDEALDAARFAAFDAKPLWRHYTEIAKDAAPSAAATAGLVGMSNLPVWQRWGTSKTEPAHPPQDLSHALGVPPKSTGMQFKQPRPQF